MIKSVLIWLFLLPMLGNTTISKVRTAYQQATQSKEITFQLLEDLSAINKNSNKVLLAYKGAVTTLKAKHLKDRRQKMQSFKEGVGLLEYAASQSPDNIEIRFIRLTIQENTPRFLKYKSNLTADKAFILAHFKEVRSADLKAYIGKYVSKSPIFAEEEKKEIDSNR